MPHLRNHQLLQHRLGQWRSRNRRLPGTHSSRLVGRIPHCSVDLSVVQQRPTVQRCLSYVGAGVEAVLFLAREPLSLRKLAQMANLADATEARTVIKSLRQRYDERGCAFQVAQVAGGYQLLSRREFCTVVAAARNRGSAKSGLSPPALETLAVVAYRQPVLRAEVEAIRGVACGEILRLLMDRDLLRIVGRSEELGRPLRYGTTKRFLEVFGLCNLDQLPWATELRRTSATDDTSGEFGPDFSGSGTDLTDGIEAA